MHHVLYIHKKAGCVSSIGWIRSRRTCLMHLALQGMWMTLCVCTMCVWNPSTICITERVFLTASKVKAGLAPSNEDSFLGSAWCLTLHRTGLLV